jgi:hypothetical protein
MAILTRDYIIKQIKALKDDVSRLEKNINEYFMVLDTRSPTLRAADNQDTTEALIEEITRRAINLAQYSTVDQDMFRRFLRERLGRS